MSKIKVGILFGGPSREREISFAGGRTVYDNLDKALFEPVLIFVDSRNTLIELDWEYVYKGTIRDFYPPVEFIPASEQDYQIYIESLDMSDEEYHSAISKIGKRIEISELSSKIDFAFLALHGRSGEDGEIQGLLDYMSIPYSGSDVVGSAVGMSKALQKRWMESSPFETAPFVEISRQQWESGQLDYDQVKSKVGFPFVVRPAHQGSSIGVAIINNDDPNTFAQAVSQAFFTIEYKVSDLQALSSDEMTSLVKELIDIKSNIGLPAYVNDQLVYQASMLHQLLSTATADITIKAVDSEQTVICEAFIDGMEFSCVVTVDEDGAAFALPPTQIMKGEEVYDYQSKYMPGRSRKITPIELQEAEIKKIQSECVALYKMLGFKVYARIDGFFTPDGRVLLNDPNTTSGMLPSSFFFHQAAELGLDPSGFITFIIRNSIAERGRYSLTLNRYESLLTSLDTAIGSSQSTAIRKQRVGVILGGYSFERHISVESGRNIYEKLASSGKYAVVPIFLYGDGKGTDRLYHIPINILLKDNADDIRDSIASYETHTVTKALRSTQKALLDKYGNVSAIKAPIDITDTLDEHIDLAFIALHGRPGEDGTIQGFLEKKGIPYNGSGPKSSSLTIDKYETLQLLKSHGFLVADQLRYQRSQYVGNDDWHTEIESQFSYPFIAKPVDDGCSSAVVKIKSRGQLETYLGALFRKEERLNTDVRLAMDLAHNEEFPQKSEVLIESLISDNGAAHFLEVTGGMLYHKEEGGQIKIEVFEPSEVLAGDEILSLEEKFLAGQGQNITPARYGSDQSQYDRISTEVKQTLQHAAELLGVEGYCRIDAFVRIYNDGRVETIIIEVNSLPGVTPATCIFHQCAINHYKPFSFIDKILNFGQQKFESTLSSTH